MPEAAADGYARVIGATSTRVFMNNRVRTTKYQWWNFIFLTVFRQFQRLANCYFLFIAILTFIDAISPYSPVTAVGPVIFVVALGVIREGVEDCFRRSSDQKQNNEGATVFNPEPNQFVQTVWQNIKVGDVVLIKEKEQFPADCVLVCSSHANGTAFINTMNLDGETTLKRRAAKPELVAYMTAHSSASLTQSLPDSPQSTPGYEALEGAGGALAQLRGNMTIRCVEPDSDLYKYDGVVELADEGQKHFPIDQDQLLLRGSQLRNTAWAAALVVYTGHESKEMQNVTEGAYKFSQVEHFMNRIILVMFMLQCVLSLIAGIAGGFWVWDHYVHHWYLDCPNDLGCNGWLMGFLQFWSYFILLNTFIPSSLVVTLEFTKAVHAIYISWDTRMHHYGNTGEWEGPVCRTTTLQEELGQINYVFSDKTGTLTQNKMEFKKGFVQENGITFSVREGDISDNVLAAAVVGDMAKNAPGGHADLYATMLSACHTVLVERKEDGEVEYNADSPDEVALVKGGMDLGYKFQRREDNDVCVVEIHGVERRFKILAEIGFTSARKRMSMLLRDADAGGILDSQVWLMTKGADNVILDRVDKSHQKTTALEAQLTFFAKEGLRTLCFACKKVSSGEAGDWTQKWAKAALLPPAERELAQEALAAEIEDRGLMVVGASAIEDKLQERVPETIHRLMRAGINVWMLTGDKQETAIEIGVSCNLITPDMFVHVLDAKDQDQMQALIQASLSGLYYTDGTDYICKSSYEALEEPLKRRFKESTRAQHDVPQCIVIPGGSLGLVCEGTEDSVVCLPSADAFVELSRRCSSVILCRSSPLQKAVVVQLVRKYEDKAITLAIGDGANDVSMIRVANIGVGVMGMEGMQAVRASDYAIMEFQDLDRLLLFHGWHAYVRLADMITVFFYKNIAFTLPLWLFGLLSAFSGGTYFLDVYTLYFNMFFTMLPPFLFSILEQRVTPDKLNLLPEMFAVSRDKEFLNIKTTLSTIAAAFLTAIFCFVVTIYCVPADKHMTPEGFFLVQNMTFFSIVLGFHVVMCIQTAHWTFVSILGYAFSLSLTIGLMCMYDELPTNDATEFIVTTPSSQGAFTKNLAAAKFWLVSVFCAGTIGVAHLLCKAYNEGIAEWPCQCLRPEAGTVLVNMVRQVSEDIIESHVPILKSRIHTAHETLEQLMGRGRYAMLPKPSIDHVGVRVEMVELGDDDDDEDCQPSCNLFKEEEAPIDSLSRSDPPPKIDHLQWPTVSEEPPSDSRMIEEQQPHLPKRQAFL